MPQRWERELQKLDVLRAPASARARIDEGPRGDGMPPSPGRRQRLFAGVVAMTLFVGALVFTVNAFGGRPGEPAAASGQSAATLTLRADTPPTADLSYLGLSAPMQTDSYCWSRDPYEMCADVVLVPFDRDRFIQIPTGTPITVDDGDASVSLMLAPGEDPSSHPPSVQLVGDVLDADVGRYVLEVAASWPQGDVRFYFPVEITASGTGPSSAAPTESPSQTPSESASPSGSVGADVAVFDVSRDPMKVTLTWQGQTVEGSIDKSWKPLGDRYDSVPIEAPPFISFSEPLTVPPDTPIRVEGTLEGWTLFPQPDSDVTHLPEKAGPVVVTLRGQWSDLEFDASFGIIVAEANSTITVPDVIGLGDQQSFQALSDAGLRFAALFRDVPGEEWKVAIQDPAPGTTVPPGSVVTLTVASRVTPLLDGATDALVCSPQERVVFGSPHMVLTPSGAAFIANVGGVKRDDRVVHVGAGTDSGLWHIVRDGGVIAVVDYETLDGVACAGSGIAGA
jgi:hypothetical protein